VPVARGALDAAEHLARAGIAYQERQPAAARFRGFGFHWLRGAIVGAGGRLDAALAAFDAEVARLDPGRLYGPEYAAWALIGRGHALLRSARPHEALAAFELACAHVEDHPHAGVGRALALGRLGRAARAAEAWQQVRQAEADMVAAGRQAEALTVGAAAAAAQDEVDTAVARLDALLRIVPASHHGWSLPIEPTLARLDAHPGVGAVLARVAQRATES
jgi:tetratricopeptide (TPR) repeat protein